MTTINQISKFAVYLKLIGNYSFFRQQIGAFFNDPKDYVGTRMTDSSYNMEDGKPSVGMIEVPAPLDSVTTKNRVMGTFENLEGKYWWDASESLFDIDLDLDNNLHIWLLQKDKKIIQYYNNIEPFTLPETEANKDKIIKGLGLEIQRSCYSSNESSGNKPDQEDEFGLLINNDTSVSIISKWIIKRKK